MPGKPYYDKIRSLAEARDAELVDRARRDPPESAQDFVETVRTRHYLSITPEYAADIISRAK